MNMQFFGTLVPERDAAGRMRRVQEHEIPVQQQDGGQAWIAEFGMPDETGMFVRLQSWDPDRWHGAMACLVHKRVRITVEVVE
jgi:hypothetical protein